MVEGVFVCLINARFASVVQSVVTEMCIPSVEHRQGKLPGDVRSGAAIEIEMMKDKV